MKRLSIRLFLITSVLVILGSGFSRKPAAKSQSKTSEPMYFFYWYDGDEFYQWATTSDAEWNLWSCLGAPVDEDSNGGATRIALGFYNTTEPHNLPPPVTLWAHF